MSDSKSFVIVGASLAGLRAAEALRSQGFDGRLVLVGDEPHLPYDRPPLSKEILQGRWEPDRLPLRQKPYEELGLEMRLGRRATGLSTIRREIELDDGSFEKYDGLLIATGASPRMLQTNPHLKGIYLLRTLDESLALRSALEKHPRVLVVGAGFIGAEVASSCRMRGLDVIMVEPQSAPLVRGLGATMGNIVSEIHRDNGVDVRCGVGVTSIEGEEHVERVKLSDGSVIETDVVVVGIGAEPATKWLEGSGIEIDDGVLCDAYCRTNVPDIFAAGDVARFHNTLFNETMRIEHWSNAVEQGVQAATNMLRGKGAEPYQHIPWFWSNQYDLKIQFAGRIQENDVMRVVWGSLEERSFVALYGRRERLTGVLAFNRSRAILKYKRRIGEPFQEVLDAS